MNMNTNTLRYVIAVAEERNFTRAAERLFISQPSLSQNIQSLERSLGTPLFDRSSSPIGLTYAGEEYLKWARSVVESEAQTLRRISDISTNGQRRLVVGVSPYRSLTIMPEVLEQFYRLTKGECSVVLVEQRSSEYMRLLEEGRVDLLIDSPAAEDGPYASVVLKEEQIFLVVPHRYAPAPDGEVDAKMLRQCPAIVLSEKQRMARLWKNVCDHMGAIPPVVLECQSLEMAYTMVQRGFGMTLVPDTLLRFIPASSDVACYTLRDFPMSRTMAALYPKHVYLGNDAKKMIELLQENLS